MNIFNILYKSSPLDRGWLVGEPRMVLGSCWLENWTPAPRAFDRQEEPRICT